MLKRFKLLSIAACVIFSSSGYAQNTHHLTRAALLKNPQAAKIIEEYNNKFDNKSVTEKLSLKMNAENQHLAQIMQDLKAHHAKFNFAKKDKFILNNTQENPAINFLNLQLSDAILMLYATQASVNPIFQALDRMYELAIQAASGIYSATERANMDVEFQACLNIINYVETIDLYDGEKKISGGNIMIQIGEQADESSTLVIKIPRHDLAGLGLENLDITTMEKAQNAIVAVRSAENIMMQVATIVNSPVLQDAELMLASIPSVLAQDFTLLDYSRNIILQSVNGVYSDSDRELMENEFDYAKAALTQTQTYVSLAGPKMLGGGNVHIQIGNEAAENTRLNISLPVTDVKKIGMDNLSIKTQAEGYHALDVMLESLHHFVYDVK